MSIGFLQPRYAAAMDKRAARLRRGGHEPEERMTTAQRFTESCDGKPAMVPSQGAITWRPGPRDLQPCPTMHRRRCRPWRLSAFPTGLHAFAPNASSTGAPLLEQAGAESLSGASPSASIDRGNNVTEDKPRNTSVDQSAEGLPCNLCCPSLDPRHRDTSARPIGRLPSGPTSAAQDGAWIALAFLAASRGSNFSMSPKMSLSASLALTSWGASWM